VTVVLLALAQTGFRRCQEMRLDAPQGRVTGAKHLGFEPFALVAQRFIGAPIGLEPLRLTVGRKQPHQRQIALLDLIVVGILSDAES